MEHLFRDRMSYIESSLEPSDGCFLCEGAAADPSRDSLVIAKLDPVLVMLNRYPYNAGHLMVAPFEHEADLDQLAPEVRSSLMEAAAKCVSALRAEYSPAAFNVGMNLGRSAGAGVPRHLHMHIVPRWEGDTNFMPVIGEAKVVPESLERTYERLAARFAT